MAHITSAERIGIKIGEERGEARGEARGEMRMQQTAVLEALKVRFRRVPEGLKEAVREIDSPKKLRALLRRAILCESIEDFADGL